MSVKIRQYKMGCYRITTLPVKPRHKAIQGFKRRNKTYAHSITKYRKTRERKNNLIAILIMIITLSANISYNHFVSLANSITINGEVVENRPETASLVVQSDEADMPMASASLPVMIGNNEIENYIVKEAIKHGVNPDKALSVSFCESSFNLEAKNPNSTATGLWQFTKGTFLDGIRWRNLTGWTLDDRKDMKKSTDMAMWFVKREGWGRWECSKF